MKVVLTRMPEAVAIDTAAIPSHETEAMSRTLIGCIGRLFEDPAIKADFEQWKKARANRSAPNN